MTANVRGVRVTRENHGNIVPPDYLSESFATRHIRLKESEPCNDFAAEFVPGTCIPCFGLAGSWFGPKRQGVVQQQDADLIRVGGTKLGERPFQVIQLRQESTPREDPVRAQAWDIGIRIDDQESDSH